MRRMVVLVSGLWLVVFVVLGMLPPVRVGEVRGLYREGDPTARYRWTSSRVQIPLRGRSGPTSVALVLGAARWPGRASSLVMLESRDGELVRFVPSAQVRVYRVLLAPQVSVLVLHASVERPPGEDGRYLGVQLFGVSAQAHGVPLRAGLMALVVACAGVALVGGLVWSFHRGYGALLALLLLAVAVRVVGLRSAPPGFSQDEVVSLVDAWSLLHTGRDHLGNWLPLGAQEALGDWISPLLTYLELPLVALFGPTPLAGRLVTAVGGALVAPCCYGVIRALGLPVPAALWAGLASALSPWQVFLSRFALPPSLVLIGWMVCVWMALRFVQRGDRDAALMLGLMAGVWLYAYPTMKLAVPLLVAFAVVVAVVRYGGRGVRCWLPGGVVLTLFWLPFVGVTLFNPASSTRWNQAALRADSLVGWLMAWWDGYRSYAGWGFLFFSGDGDPIHGVPGWGMEPLVLAPLLVLGVGALVWGCAGRWRASSQVVRSFAGDWWLIAGALVIAPLPASLTNINPHAFRAGAVAPLCSVLAGVGVAVLWRAVCGVQHRWWRRVLGGVMVLGLGGTLVGQSGMWFVAYTRDYPPSVAWTNQDGLLEAMDEVVAAAPRFDQVWISTDDITAPYLYVLAARALPLEQAQALIEVERRPGHLNHVWGIGRYRFVSLRDVPRDVSTIAAVPDRFGGPGFVVQVWERSGQRLLILRRMM